MMLQGALQLQRGRFRLETGPFEIEAGGVTAIFGASGAGKTTLLRAIAGLEPDVRGQLRWGDETWQAGAYALPAHRRGIGFVFQDAALFPHLTVRGNCEFALRRAPRRDLTVESMAARVGLADRLDHPVQDLSGGERQRVAIARALLSGPRLLCMDEPLSALDWTARAGLLALIDDLARETGIPIVYVTHASAEVERLARHVVFMADGRIGRIESLRAALARPDSPLFEEEGPVSVLEGRVDAADADGLVPFVTGGGVHVRMAQSHGGPPAHGSRLRILARDVSLALAEPERISILNHLPATVTALSGERDGRVVVSLGLADGQVLLAEVTAYSAGRLELRSGQSLWALIKSVALVE